VTQSGTTTTVRQTSNELFMDGQNFDWIEIHKSFAPGLTPH
jgi:hypothetical protein